MLTSGECMRNYRRRVCSLAYEKMMHALVHEPPLGQDGGAGMRRRVLMSLTASRGTLEAF